MNLNKDIYIAIKNTTSSFDEYSNETVTYQIPIKYNFNVQPLSGSSDTQIFGERILLMQRAVIPYDKYFKVFKEGDLAYLDGQVPTGEAKYGNNANYEIYSVSNQNEKIVILFQRLLGK